MTGAAAAASEAAARRTDVRRDVMMSFRECECLIYHQEIFFARARARANQTRPTTEELNPVWFLKGSARSQPAINARGERADVADRMPNDTPRARRARVGNCVARKAPSSARSGRRFPGVGGGGPTERRAAPTATLPPARASLLPRVAGTRVGSRRGGTRGRRAIARRRRRRPRRRRRRRGRVDRRERAPRRSRPSWRPPRPSPSRSWNGTSARCSGRGRRGRRFRTVRASDSSPRVRDVRSRAATSRRARARTPSERTNPRARSSAPTRRSVRPHRSPSLRPPIEPFRPPDVFTTPRGPSFLFITKYSHSGRDQRRGVRSHGRAPRDGRPRWARRPLRAHPPVEGCGAFAVVRFRFGFHPRFGLVFTRARRSTSSTKSRSDRFATK